MEEVLPGLVVLTNHGDYILSDYQNEEQRQKQLDWYMTVAQTTGRFNSIETCQRRRLSAQYFHSGCKAFDKQYQGVMPDGNLVANTFWSTFVRGGLQTECNGYAFGVGELMGKDIDMLDGAVRDIRAATRWLRAHLHDKHESVVAVLVHHTYMRDGQTHRVVHGFMVMDRAYRLLKRFDRHDLGLNHQGKSMRIMDLVQTFSTEEQLLNRKRVWEQA